MPDLVEKYFGMDLSVSEQESLSNLLLESDEAALKFEALAEQAYHRYGLPEPQPHWPQDPGPTPGRRTSPWPWVWGMVLVIGMAGLYWSPGPLGSHLSKLKASISVPGKDPSSTQERGRNPSVGTSQKPSAKSKAQVAGASRVPEQQKEQGQQAEFAGGAVPSNVKRESVPGNGSQVAPSSPVVTGNPSLQAPIPVSADPSRSFSNLSVIVEQAAQGQILVRVLDARGIETKLLYEGGLAPGTWAFEWDGKIASGVPARPGIYQIEVKLGVFTQRKTIQIQ